MPNDLLRATRARSLQLAAPLSDEDAQLQSMPDASPAKWHLAHTTWFFETLVLAPYLPDYRLFDERWPRLFNSYYESLGPRHARPQRGLLSRPSMAEVRAYRAHVDAALADLLPVASAEARGLIELGCHHEQQHQELLLTDILHAFSCNPLLPAYDATPPAPTQAPAQEWLEHPGGIVDIGHAGAGFAFDNEGPRHRVLIEPFEIASRLVTCGEYADFVESGGYREPLLWLSDGWALAQAQGWQRPAYWLEDGRVFGLHGAQAMDRDAPVMQLSFYEACAYAEWAGARLPTEFEWEAACGLPGFAQAADQAWQWTRSAYSPYPGFKPAPGAVGEYNGKFMVGQQVLRGGSLATPPGHARPTYRNFFPPAARWQFSGVRLAR
ncbi:ergothioneine biosynthesis protein EgtB [Pelomonas sp. P7]|uniref:Ergothioneine biosynthesis protein EgtB n=1 Tax=Pelomonas caseinilytica TaxID=2906763 RepID=A0ABS8XDE8_9BURK|nr:ergothioneine biosynthesis protein EgtB [Pelomonas sp. P7]MCE4537012.1 ergothioneine biosynthesis protein EgtB [Pelomonas sp. P7]